MRKQIQISLNCPDACLLDNLAKTCGISRSAFVRLLMQHYLATEAVRQGAVCSPAQRTNPAQMQLPALSPEPTPET